MKPLASLITGRGFDHYQPGLRSRFYDLGYQLSYCGPANNPAMRLDFKTSVHIARAMVWESGACHFEVVDAASGTVVFSEDLQFRDDGEFHDAIPRLVDFLRKSLPSTT